LCGDALNDMGEKGPEDEIVTAKLSQTNWMPSRIPISACARRKAGKCP
jgi:hypothetical protein